LSRRFPTTAFPPSAKGMATAEQFAAMLQAQQEMQRGMMEVIGRMAQQPSNMVNNRGIGKPPTFTGDKAKYA
jgi:hypothetical protein